MMMNLEPNHLGLNPLDHLEAIENKDKNDKNKKDDKKDNNDPQNQFTKPFSANKLSISSQSHIISLKSHEKSQSNPNNTTRKDKFGQVINKKLNKHKISFKDQIEKTKVYEVKEVESYKEFNKDCPVRKGKNIRYKLL